MGTLEFYVMVERGEDGYYVGEVPSLNGCFSQGRTIDELMANMKEAIALCLEAEPDAIHLQSNNKARGNS